jgi:hemerythrin-like metal-binding protein
MVDFGCTPQLDLEFMNREHRKAFDDANALKILLDKALKCRLDNRLNPQPEKVLESEVEVQIKADLSESDSVKIERLLQRLLLDTVTHFELEEQCMEEHCFPARAEHCQEHQRVLQWMAQEHSLWIADCSLSTITHLRDYAADKSPNWLVNHIVTMDTVLASYVHRHGGRSL